MEDSKVKKSWTPAVPEERRIITLHGALVVRSDGEGEVILSFPGRKLTTQEEAVLRALFPHTREQLQVLMDTETLLAAIDR